VALVTDAGTPGVSDPGGRLVAEAVAAGVAVVPIPGPSAVLAALTASGLPMARFTFLGFLSRRPGRMKRELTEAAALGTVVFYESPHRIVKTLVAAREALGDVPVAVARELTKVHEEFLRGPLSQVAAALAARPKVLGEITVVLSAQENPPDPGQEISGMTDL
jgi:16S rRNA (cytidine1402-2'-O)-methyltransferase